MAIGRRGGATFSRFWLKGQALDNTGRLYFIANLARTGAITKNNDSGIWGLPGGLLLQKDAPVASLADGSRHAGFDTQLAANDAGEVATFNRLGGVNINSAGRVAFHGKLREGAVTAANNEGAWTDSSGALELIARENTVAPGFGDPTVVFDEFGDLFINDDGIVFFEATTRGGMPPLTARENDGIFAFVPGSGLSLVAAEGDPAPDTPGVFISLPAVSVHRGGELAFSGILRRGVGGVGPRDQHGVWTLGSAGEPVQLLVRAGDTFLRGDETVTIGRPFISDTPDGGTGGRSGAVACGNIVVIVIDGSGPGAAAFIMRVPDPPALP